MAVDTFVAYIGVYPSVEDAEADYQLVKDLHTKAGMLDAYDAAVIEKREDGKVRITKKHETPTRVGGVLGGGCWVWLPGLSWLCFRSPQSGVVARSHYGRWGSARCGGRPRGGWDEPQRSQRAR